MLKPQSKMSTRLQSNPPIEKLRVQIVLTDFALHPDFLSLNTEHASASLHLCLELQSVARFWISKQCIAGHTGVSVKPLLMVENDNTLNLYAYLLFTHTQKEKHNCTKQKRLTEYNRTEENKEKNTTQYNTA